ncbi:hypothetical protein [Nocardioides campestrisoli]|uniref:hypothetical protein n=1 Tax=Nocardioides campestrisoli TaxID=2736757 RepID=UPI0015E67534|nr:hypothetical protein [Nocardioides campestrisoli]
MTAPGIDIREHYEIFEDLLTTALSPRKLYEFGSVPGVGGNKGDQPAIYGLLDVQRRPYTPQAISGHADVTGWAVTVVGVGRIRDEAAWVLNRASRALEELVVTVDGHDSTPLMFDAFDAIRPEGDRHAGRVAYTYVL